MSQMLRKSARKRKLPSRLDGVSTSGPVTAVSTTTPRSYSSVFVSSNSSGPSLVTQHPCTSMPVLTTNFPIPVVTTVSYPTASQLPHSTVAHPAVSQLPIAPVALPTGSQLPIAADQGHQQPQLAISGNMQVQNPVQMHIPNQTLGATSDLAINVPQNIKEKIQKGEYVDISVLLTNNQHNTDTNQKVIIQNGELIMQPKQNAPKINNIETWTNAFIVYTSIYCGIHVNQFQDLLKYMSMVRLGASRTMGLGWKSYDEQFRLRKTQNPSSSWSIIDQELWLL